MRVGIVEDQPLLQDVLAEGLRSRGVVVAFLARDAGQVAALLDRDPPDALLLDVRLPPDYTDEGLQIAQATRARHPEIGLLVLSSFGELDLAERLLTLQDPPRAVGYLLKERVGNLDELVGALGRVADGDVVIDPNLINGLMTRRRAASPLDSLSPHERRILAMVAEGRSNLGIAEQMACQVGTVEKHLSAITSKLGLSAIDQPQRRGMNVRVLAALAFLRGMDHRVGR
ncbi:MAG TPA: response regulator transcription factor [Actinokineospora sp.]|jgi:DNA-binding NarL/FixJ family response regulator|nr:response regulator transcription factor [Actinokineospora sp.]